MTMFSNQPFRDFIERGSAWPGEPTTTFAVDSLAAILPAADVSTDSAIAPEAQTETIYSTSLPSIDVADPMPDPGLASGRMRATPDDGLDGLRRRVEMLQVDALNEFLDWVSNGSGR